MENFLKKRASPRDTHARPRERLLLLFVYRLDIWRASAGSVGEKERGANNNSRPPERAAEGKKDDDDDDGPLSGFLLPKKMGVWWPRYLVFSLLSRSWLSLFFLLRAGRTADPGADADATIFNWFFGGKKKN